MQQTAQTTQPKTPELITITQDTGIPLLGSIAFGIIDRGSNLIQVRPTTICNLQCTFCSTNANNFQLHPVNYTVEPNYLLQWITEAAKLKQTLHVNIDSVGEPTTYPHLTYLIAEAKKLPETIFISMQTNGTLLTHQTIKHLETAGLNRINLSIHSLNPELGKALMGRAYYNLNKILQTITTLQQSTIQTLLAPVWIPNINDQEIEKIITFAKENKLCVAIQKYEEYTHSRKQPRAKKTNFYQFYQQLKQWEKHHNIQLVYHAHDLQITNAPSFPIIFNKGERTQATIKAPGWMPKQQLATAKNRCITIVNSNANIGDKINIKIIENNHNIYLAKQLP